MKCECGYDNPDGSKFCGKCGKDLRQKRKAKESISFVNLGISIILMLIITFQFNIINNLKHEIENQKKDINYVQTYFTKGSDFDNLLYRVSLLESSSDYKDKEIDQLQDIHGIDLIAVWQYMNEHEGE